MMESAKDGSMEKLFAGGKESVNPCDWPSKVPCGPVGGGVCFSGISSVETPRGKIPIGDLRLGDNVLTYTPEKGAHYTEVKENR